MVVMVTDSKRALGQSLTGSISSLWTKFSQRLSLCQDTVILSLVFCLRHSTVHSRNQSKIYGMLRYTFELKVAVRQNTVQLGFLMLAGLIFIFNLCCFKFGKCSLIYCTNQYNMCYSRYENVRGNSPKFCTYISATYNLI